MLRGYFVRTKKFRTSALASVCSAEFVLALCVQFLAVLGSLASLLHVLFVIVLFFSSPPFLVFAVFLSSLVSRLENL